MNVRLPQDSDHPIITGEDLYPVMQSILLRENKFGRSQEHFWIVGLDAKHKILFVELIGLGQNNRVHADAPTIFRMAIYKMAAKAVLVHNHPSGVMRPSHADLDFTDRVYKAGKMLLIEVIDHLIISETEFISFAKKGEMENIKVSGKYELLNDEQKELLKLKMEHDNSLAIARKLMKEGMTIDFIKKVTGLRKVDLEDL